MTIALPQDLFRISNGITFSSVPDGAEARMLAQLALHGRGACFVARDSQRTAQIAQALRFYAPELTVLDFPAWDCLPYDRVSPNADIMARRMTTLSRLSENENLPDNLIILTTANAIIQKVPGQSAIRQRAWSAAAGNVIEMDDVVRWLEDNGFTRTPTVRESGEYAVRGGILDLFAPGKPEPIRLDFFGDTLESIRTFDAETQRTIGQVPSVDLIAAGEAILDEDSIKRFRRAYVKAFGAAQKDDALYQAISEGRRYAGMEHWLGFLSDDLVPFSTFLGERPIILDHLGEDAVAERLDQIKDHYEARLDSLERDQTGLVPYKPAPPESLFLREEDWKALLADHPNVTLSRLAVPETNDRPVHDFAGRQGRSFAAERTAGDVNVFDALIEHLSTLRKTGSRVIIACWSEGTRERMAQVLADHGLERLKPIDSWEGLDSLEKGMTALAVLQVESGFLFDGTAVIAEQDILGDRLVRQRKKRKKASEFLTEATSLSEGDLIVHVEHGVGRFVGLKTIEAAGAPHDCLELVYHGGDKLFLPVENIELLSRYGSEDTEAQLDKLGGVAWQAKKAKLKQRIREIADNLIKVAAARALKTAPKILAPEGVYDEFAARFPFEETDDQLNAIDSIFEDLSSGRPMDRLICGDVGFGKTEVALRAAFLAAMSGRQVAVVVPTTLLARQHYRTFAERFSGLPINVAQASRLVGSSELSKTKKGVADGTVDIVIGTHALLGKSISFRDLGLLIIDEEQHFGVKHKERLKELKSDVHVLTLSATPIPRTLQLALTGVRELSLIATPPVDRLAVRTFFSPFDPLIVREALLRERYRGGQSFYVCPRVSDLAETRAFLEEHVPEVKVAVAHGQMPAGELDDIMNAFYEGKYDVLLSTTIVESGIDIPTANTLIVHRADMFGLAQLYQLRGRVGRSKVRAYSLFTVPARKKLTVTAERRLKVLQSLDTLGAGFQLASHDMDIRGAGNLLGEEQSGHIKEVGYELYQQMLEEAVASLKAGDGFELEEQWSPQITVGTPVMIPEVYVPDLQLRLGLYKRLSDLTEPGDIDAFGAELIDRFGPLPEEVDHLLKIVFVKGLCRKANVEKIDAGPKGIVVTFRNGEYANPVGLVRFITEQGTLAKIRPDQKLVLMRDWPTPEKRLKGTAVILSRLAKMAEESDAAA
ncbi:transcription-repair coupling factor [Coralliovum pocilloporae]|uniref:transcription-repair coupling factor n=1 Tax=Coralliovum pocilloporae TaxID=3066369 RepID=UPI0033077B44